MEEEVFSDISKYEANVYGSDDMNFYDSYDPFWDQKEKKENEEQTDINDD